MHVLCAYAAGALLRGRADRSSPRRTDWATPSAARLAARPGPPPQAGFSAARHSGRAGLALSCGVSRPGPALRRFPAGPGLARAVRRFPAGPGLARPCGVPGGRLAPAHSVDSRAAYARPQLVAAPVPQPGPRGARAARLGRPLWPWHAGQHGFPEPGGQWCPHSIRAFGRFSTSSPPYKPGKAPSAPDGRSFKLSSNESPFGPLPSVRQGHRRGRGQRQPVPGQRRGRADRGDRRALRCPGVARGGRLRVGRRGPATARGRRRARAPRSCTPGARSRRIRTCPTWRARPRSGCRCAMRRTTWPPWRTRSPTGRG